MSEKYGRVDERRQSEATIIDLKSTNQQARILSEHLGSVKVDLLSSYVYRYTGSFWEYMSDARLRRELAGIFERNHLSFSSSKLEMVVHTMKDIIPEIPVSDDELIGFSNGVYDMATNQFRTHDPDDGLLAHNGIIYTAANSAESIQVHAPNFFKWLSYAAEGCMDKMDRITAALFMVLTHRYDWQLFLEVTGSGGSGKSIMANLCALLVGSRNIGSSSMRLLDSDFGLEGLWDKRLILLPDQPKYIGDGAILKAITGGDAVAINRKGKPMFSAKVRAVVLVTNNAPMEMTERNGGIARRRVIFSFNNVVTDEDSQIESKISNELPVIIRYLLSQYPEPMKAKRQLLAQRGSMDAIVVKREADPLFDLCTMVKFMPKANGLRMGGKTDIKREPHKFFYHLYLSYMHYHGIDNTLSVNAVSRALKQIAKELGSEYRVRSSNGTVTNIVLTKRVDEFLLGATDYMESE
ncbi:TPA: DNA primase family protein [Aeromonas veronii]|nr:DUF5906 domain-containing protein [Aeromonas veronii]MBL0595314.1 hypothetical protein [Aeromonas veronii]NJI25533.1 hypothetical protein [Aeromonas veronii]NJI35833.1 hypothetical protein [Aeromonas veronii]TNJ00917.1 hypothetical protein CF114_05250 [Aeromonas veronii]